MEEFDQLRQVAYQATQEFLGLAKLNTGDLLVVGCSSSEIGGQKIGSDSSPAIAQAVFGGIYQAAQEREIFLAAQCCEHLNRALILEQKIAKTLRLPVVNVVPQPKAGGSFATAAYAAFSAPVAVEAVQADAGMDIGDTLIGMHLKPVAVPVRLSVRKIGEANLVCARTRPKFIGGVRAHYDDALL